MLERFYSNPEIEAKFQEWVRNKHDIKNSHDTRRLQICQDCVTFFYKTSLLSILSMS